LALKQQKIAQLRMKLTKIRESALFLGDMSEMHRKQLKEMKARVGELEDEKKFLES